MRTTPVTAEVSGERTTVGAMQRVRAGLALTAAALVMTMMTACSSSAQRDAEKKADEAKQQAGEAVEKAKATASEAAADASKAAKEAAATVRDSAKEAAAKYGPKAKDAALKGAAAAAEMGADAAVTAGRATENAAVRAAGLLRTGAIRAALLRESTLDVSNVDIHTDEPGKRVRLTGRVKSNAQKTSIERIAHDKAPGYTIENQLVVRS